jgi:DNA-binding NarL/FixJ family response regulator
MSIKILLADDHKIMREGLRILIDKQPDMEVVAEAENGLKAIQLVKELLPDVVIMDVTMTDLNGIEATRQITAEFPDVKVLALSMHSHKQFITRILSAGASGYMLKDCAFEELIHAIHASVEKKSYLSPSIAGIVITEYLCNLSDNESSTYSLITPMEREVLQFLAEGKTTKQIASCLYMSLKTVESHRRRIMDKLNIHSIAKLTKYAIIEGITPLET